MLGAIQAEQWVFMGALLLGSLLNAILFFRIFERSYFEPHRDAPAPRTENRAYDA